jgi:group I intron endonuclease
MIPKPSDFYINSPDVTFSGIYCISCKVNGKIYIGSARSLYERWGYHLSNYYLNKSSFNKNLRKDFDKFGVSNFNWSILHVMSEYNKVELDKKEKEFIKSYLDNGFSLYNIKY